MSRKSKGKMTSFQNNFMKLEFPDGNYLVYPIIGSDQSVMAITLCANNDETPTPLKLM